MNEQNNNGHSIGALVESCICTSPGCDTESKWNSCAEPLPVGSPVVACPFCEHFFYIIDGEVSTTKPFFNKCPKCKKRPSYSELGAIAFVLEYRVQQGKKIRVTYNPEHYPNTIGDHDYHVTQAKQLVKRWELVKDVRKFEKANIDVGDVRIGDLANLSSYLLHRERPQFSRLLDYLSERWGGDRARIGTMYLTRSEDQNLEIRIPLRFCSSDDEFTLLQDWIEDGNAEEHYK